MVANSLYQVGLDISHAVGQGAAAEFQAFIKLYDQLPDIEAILQGQGQTIPFPQEPSQRVEKAGHEWVQLFATDLFRQARARNELGQLAGLVQQDKRLQQMFAEYMAFLEG